MIPWLYITRHSVLSISEVFLLLTVEMSLLEYCCLKTSVEIQSAFYCKYYCACLQWMTGHVPCAMVGQTVCHYVVTLVKVMSLHKTQDRTFYLQFCDATLDNKLSFCHLLVCPSFSFCLPPSSYFCTHVLYNNVGSIYLPASATVGRRSGR